MESAVWGLLLVGDGESADIASEYCPPDTVPGMGAVVPHTLTAPGRVWVGNPPRSLPKSAYEAVDVPAGEPE